jgi:hypothetical protein
MPMKLLPERSSGGAGNSALLENPQREWQTRGSGEFAAGRENRWKHRFLAFNLIALLLVAAVMRCRDLGRMPGINGDEAWYGVQVERLLAGRPMSGLTPTGNLLNPFFFGPQLFLHWLFGASFALLRTTSILSGLAALALNYWFCRPIFGRRVAVVSTVILAVLPIDLAYSRLAWDTAQSLLFTLPAVYLPLRAVIDPARRLRWSLWSIAALGAALIVHPTNIFTGPIMAACLGYTWRHELRAWWSGAAIAGWDNPRIRFSAQSRRWITAIVAGGFCVTIAWMLGARLEAAARRIVDLRQYAAFALDFGHLFNGATVYEYISGSMAPQDGSDVLRQLLPLDVLTWLVIGWLGFGLRRRLAGRKPVELCLAIGGTVGLLGFFIVAGTGGIAANFERYSLWMIGPAALLAALACDRWFDGSRRRWAALGAVSLAWLLLFTFQCNYFECFNSTGGEGHSTYRTGNIEPKQAALAYIVAHARPDEFTTVWASEWWNYWPLEYLALAAEQSARKKCSSTPDHLIIERWKSNLGFAQFGGHNQTGISRLWLVEFTAGDAAAAIRNWASSQQMHIHETNILDAANRPVLSVFQIDETRSKATASGRSGTRPAHPIGENYKKN